MAYERKDIKVIDKNGIETIYPTCAAAGRALGVSREIVRLRSTKPHNNTLRSGHTIIAMDKAEKTAIPAVVVIDKTTGEEVPYKSHRAASIAMGRSPGYINLAVRNAQFENKTHEWYIPADHMFADELYNRMIEGITNGE